MPHFHFEQKIEQLEKRMGGYNYLFIDHAVVEQFEKKKSVRLKCEIDRKVAFSCGLNHLGDGNFYIIVASKHLKTLDKEIGSVVNFEIYEDPNPLGVEVPEALHVLLEQDDNAKAVYDTLTDGKKRSLIYTIVHVKNIDLQIKKTLDFLEEERIKSAKKRVKSSK